MKTQRIHSLSGTLFLASCFLLLAGACEEADRFDGETPAREVVLNFDASVAHTEASATRSCTTIDAFSDNAYRFGISITKDNATKGTIFAGSDDLTATMSRTAQDAPWKWSFKRTSGNVDVDAPLKGPAGKPLKVIAYYPATGTAGTFTGGIPFDFTATSSLKQTEILYNTATSAMLSASADGSAANIPLRFQHAYSWIVINVTKNIDKDDVKLNGVTIGNQGGNWIKNQGTISPETGLAMEGSVAGPIGEIKASQPLNATSSNSPVTYAFLVPSFMDANVKDGDISITLSINNNNNIGETYLLNREHLNQDGNAYGFRQGYMNTYNLEFNNTALSLNLVSWTSTILNGNFGGNIAVSWDYRLLLFNTTNYVWPSILGTPSTPALSKPTFLAADAHPYENYLTTVGLGSNGNYVPASAVVPVPAGGYNLVDYVGVGTSEGTPLKLYMTTEDISIEQVPWADENGTLRAKEICRKYNGGGMTGWRLPRVAELRAIFAYCMATYGVPAIKDLGFGKDANQYKNYWTGTEADATKAWGIYYYSSPLVFLDRGPVLSVINKGERCAVRCVRDYYPTDPQ